MLRVLGLIFLYELHSSNEIQLLRWRASWQWCLSFKSAEEVLVFPAVQCFCVLFFFFPHFLEESSECKWWTPSKWNPGISHHSDAAFAVRLQKCLQCICFLGAEFQMLIYSLPSAWIWWFCQVTGQNYDLFADKKKKRKHHLKHWYLVLSAFQ